MEGARWISRCAPGAIDENRERGCGRHVSILAEDADLGRRLLAEQQNATGLSDFDNRVSREAFPAVGCVVVVAPSGRRERDGDISALTLCGRDLGEAGKPANREHNRCTLRPRDIDLRRIGSADIPNIADVKADL